VPASAPAIPVKSCRPDFGFAEIVPPGDRRLDLNLAAFT
jgi:hypothetical protein